MNRMCFIPTTEGRAALKRKGGRYMLRCGWTSETSQAKQTRTRRLPVGGLDVGTVWERKLPRARKQLSGCPGEGAVWG